jgi:hypothetical protein
VEVFFGQIEMGEAMFVHELDDFTDFLEVHGWMGLVESLSEVTGACAVRFGPCNL